MYIEVPTTYFLVCVHSQFENYTRGDAKLHLGRYAAKCIQEMQSRRDIHGQPERVGQE